MRNGILFLIGLLMLAGCETSNDQPAYREIIATSQAPEAVGPYSQAVQAGNTLYLAGQVGRNPETGELAGESLEAQTRQALKNIGAVLDEAAFSITDIADVQVFLTDVSQYSAFNKLYADWIGEQPPPRTLVEVSALPLGARVEIKVTAVK